MNIIRRDERPTLPDWAKCPCCGKPALIDGIEEWERLEDESWIISETGFHLTCETEPELGSISKFNDWLRYHYDPYPDEWLGLEAWAWEWLKANYRVDMEAVNPDEERTKLDAWNKGEARKVEE